MSQFDLCFMQGDLLLSQGFFGPLLFAQVKNESDTLAPAFFKQCSANHHGNPAPIFAEVLFLEGLESSSRLYLRCSTLVAVTPFCRRQVRPADTSENEIFAAESQHV